MNQTKKLILDEKRIKQIIRRIAYQIHENNMSMKDLAIVGICDQGFKLAGKFVEELQSINNKISISHLRLDLDKNEPHETAKLSEDVEVLSGKSVILVDDVLYLLHCIEKHLISQSSMCYPLLKLELDFLQS